MVTRDAPVPTGVQTDLRLAATHTTSTGVVILTYHPTTRDP